MIGSRFKPFFVIALIFLFTSSLLAQSRLVSRFGISQVQGRDVLVHVWLLVPPGLDENEVARAALADQGARPFNSQEFSTTGLVWDQFFDGDPGTDYVLQNYNPANDPSGGVAEQSLLTSHHTWSEVGTSKFALDFGEYTDRCPSLVRECPGPQYFDGFNDVAWLNLSGCCTLAVTWFGTSTDEADIALNLKFPWETNGVDHYDIETVFLHENGHLLGLGHSEIEEAVMWAYYAGVRRDLHPDDMAGVTFLYPADGSTGAIAGTVTALDGTAISGAVVEVNGTSLFAVSLSNGQYSLDQVPAGIYDLTASADGFVSQTISSVLVEAEEASLVDFVLDPLPAGSSVFVDQITYSTNGGRNNDRHLRITVWLEDDWGNPVGGASVTIQLYRNGSSVGSASGTTGSSGTVTFELKNAASGCYETVVTNVTDQDLVWNGVTPPNQFCK